MQVGWALANGTSSGYVPGTNAEVSYVTYLATDGSNAFTTVVESMKQGPWAADGSDDYTRQGKRWPQAGVSVAFQLAGALRTAWAGKQLQVIEKSLDAQFDSLDYTILQVWHTNTSVSFKHEQPITIASDGTFSITVEPSAIYTLTSLTTNNGHPGGDELVRILKTKERGSLYSHKNPAMTTQRPRDPEPIDSPFPLPHGDDFESYANDSLPLYLSDMQVIDLPSSIDSSLRLKPR